MLFELYGIIMFNTARVFQQMVVNVCIFNANDRQQPSNTYTRECMDVFAWVFFAIVITIGEISFCIFYRDFQDGNNYAKEIRNEWSLLVVCGRSRSLNVESTENFTVSRRPLDRLYSATSRLRLSSTLQSEVSLLLF